MGSSLSFLSRPAVVSSLEPLSLFYYPVCQVRAQKNKKYRTDLSNRVIGLTVQIFSLTAKIRLANSVMSDVVTVLTSTQNSVHQQQKLLIYQDSPVQVYLILLMCDAFSDVFILIRSFSVHCVILFCSGGASIQVLYLSKCYDTTLCYFK